MTTPLHRILAIDDTPANLIALDAMLAGEFDFQFATTGPMGVALALKNPPDLILLDIMMPEIDGHETFRRLAAQPSLKDIPVVFVTALNDFDSEVTGLSMGAADYITKPVNVTIARQRIRNLIARKEDQQALQRSEDLFRNTFRLMPASLTLQSPEAVLVECSDDFCTATGFAREAVIGRNTLELNLWADPQQLAAMQQELQNDGQVDALEFQLKRRDGNVTTMQMSARCLEIDGQPLLLSFAHDISKRKQAETESLVAKNHLQATLNAIPDLLFEVDESGRMLSYHAHRSNLLAAPPEVFLGKCFADVLPPAATQVCMNALDEAKAKGWSAGGTYALPLPQGETWFELSVAVTPERGDLEPRFIFLARDITERKQSEEALRIAATAFESQHGMAITNAQRVILRVNPAFTDITGYSVEEVVGQNPRLLKSGRHDSAYYEAMTQALEQQGAWAGEIWNRRKSGEIYPEWLNISAVKDNTSLTTHYVAIFTDISERISAQAQIETLAFYDPLTHLPNRRLLLDRLEQALHTSTRHSRKNALLFVDLDNFKTLNDTLGHQQGDRLLVQVAHRLKTCIRDGDTLARLGSDEFVVMLENLSEDDIEAATQAETVGSNVLKAFQQDFPLDQGVHHSTPSIGITLFGGVNLESSEQPLKRAELAMFQAKAAGRNMLRFFDARMQAEVSALAALEADLREAVAKNEFLLHYQPQVVGAGRITGVEALVRWQHPQRGMVSPAEFIPLAEDSGLILPLGQWVLETACAQLTAWATQPDLTHLTMAVNVSARQFRQPDFVGNVLATLERTRANPKRLKLEMTESMLVGDVEAVIAKMGTLKAYGVSFSLDDFGTGYSSLAYLKRLPFDQLKIDQGFVRNIVTDTNDAAIAKMVVVLAESMGLSVIAEGVELQAQADFLAHQGCHAYQGYLFSKPLSLEALEIFVKRV